MRLLTSTEIELLAGAGNHTGLLSTVHSWSQIMQQINRTIDRRAFSKLTVSLLATFFLPGSHAQIGGAPEALNSQDFEEDGTRNRLEPNIKRFFGNAVGDYFDLTPERLDRSITAAEAVTVRRQFLRVFNDLPGGIVNLPDGNQITFARQSGDAFNIALVVTPQDSNTIISTAMLHMRCGKSNGAPLGSKEFKNFRCDQVTVFTIIWGKEVAPTQEINRELVDWMVKFIKEETRDEKVTRFEKIAVEVRRLG